MKKENEEILRTWIEFEEITNKIIRDFTLNALKIMDKQKEVIKNAKKIYKKDFSQHTSKCSR